MINQDYETVPERIEWCVWTGHNIDEVMQLGGHGQWSFRVGYPYLTLYGWNNETIANKGEYVVYNCVDGTLKGYPPEKFHQRFRVAKDAYQSVLTPPEK